MLEQGRISCMYCEGGVRTVMSSPLVRRLDSTGMTSRQRQRTLRRCKRSCQPGLVICSAGISETSSAASRKLPLWTRTRLPIEQVSAEARSQSAARRASGRVGSEKSASTASRFASLRSGRAVNSSTLSLKSSSDLRPNRGNTSLWWTMPTTKRSISRASWSSMACGAPYTKAWAAKRLPGSSSVRRSQAKMAATAPPRLCPVITSR
mmetsp:Transcript_4213/g.12582  ORF Transcript_4213/g.12582 Transcript_4213/m.12582 type:complete len:207 (-) Transcript_4213:944-1564(-)